jgi:hypothetical protein
MRRQCSRNVQKDVEPSMNPAKFELERDIVHRFVRELGHAHSHRRSSTNGRLTDSPRDPTPRQTLTIMLSAGTAPNLFQLRFPIASTMTIDVYECDSGE